MKQKIVTSIMVSHDDDVEYYIRNSPICPECGARRYPDNYPVFNAESYICPNDCSYVGEWVWEEVNSLEYSW